MADDDKPSGRKLPDIGAFLTKKTGPLPNAVYIFIAAALLFYIYKRNQQKKAASATTNPSTADQGQFSSTTTSTDPTTGTSTTYSANGPSTGFLNTGPALVQGAGNMPYSGGDIYVNYPGQSTAPQQGPPGPAGPPGQGNQPAYPPKHSQPGPVGSTGGWWITLPKDLDASQLADLSYNLGNTSATTDNPQDLSKNPGAIQIMAADLVGIMRANPQINWTNVNSAGKGLIPAGTALYVPLAGGQPGLAPTLPFSYTSYDAPASYSPPNQTSSMITPGGNSPPWGGQ